jgi:gliding motility-associated-like protein
MNKLSTQVLAALFFIAAFFISNTASASHIMGSDISFRCLGGNQYEVVVTVYRDCSGISVPGTIPVDISSTCGTQTIICNQDAANSGIEVSQLCPTAQSTCVGGSFPGVQVYTYVGTVTLQPGCGTYSMSYDDCCRNPSNNIVNPTAQGFRVTATLNSNLVACNTAPQFTSSPIPYFCLNQPVNYSHGAIDADGDSLVYSLIAPLDDLGGNVPYVAPYTPTSPMPTASGFNFDAATGQMTFTPTQQGVYVVDVLVSEYRNGQLIGTTMRDIQIVVINCSNNSPNVTNCLNLQNVSGAVVYDCNSLGVCPGQSMSFTIGGKDADGQPITVSSNIAQSIPGASLVTNNVGSDSVTVTFSWTPTGVDTGFRYFTIQFEDNACPITGLQLFTYEISVLDGTDAGPDRFYCTGGGPVTIQAVGGNTFSWDNTNGWISATPDSSTVVVAPLTTQTYIVQSDLQGGCKNRDTVTVFNVQTFTTLTSSPDDTICLNSSTDVSVLATPSNEGPFTYLWGPSGSGVQTSGNQTTEVRPSTTTTYYVTVTSASGCPIVDSIDIVINGVGPKIVVNPSDNYVCPGDVVTLNSIVKAVECGPAADPQNACLPGSTYALNQVGNGTGSTTVTTPYFGFWMDARLQYLYRASELQAAGLSAGSILDISYYVTGKFSTQPYNEFTVKMGCTSLNQLPANYVAGLTEVVAPAPYTTDTGWNTHTLTTPYQWDGFSNLIVEVCFNNSSYTDYDDIQFTATSFPGSVLYDFGDLSGSSGCTALTTPVLAQERPNMRFVMCNPPLSNYTFTWTGSDGSTLPNTPNPTVAVNNDVTYNVVIDDGTCQGDTSVALFVDTAVLINAGLDTIICGADTIQLNAFLENPVVPVCVPNYNLSSIPYNPITNTGAVSNGPTGDDVMSGAFPIGFNFEYFCNAYSNFYVSTNGFITFTAGQGSSFTSQNIPNAAAPNNLIALCWEDLLTNAGTITYFVDGVAPNRKLVVRWTNSTFFAAAGNFTGQIQLHETTNVIELHLGSMTATGQTATVGLENGNGSVGISPPGFNNSGWTVSTPVAFRFTPQVSGAGLVGVQWSPSVGLSDTTILNPQAYPSVTTDYVLAATFSNGCVTYDTVRVAIGDFQFTTSVIPDSICSGDAAQLQFNGGVSWTWSPAASLNSDVIANPSATPAVTTDYVVVAFDSIGCRAEDTLTVVVRTHPAISLGADQSVCPYDSVTLSPTGGPYTSYDWSTGATTPTITTASQSTITQDYWVRVNDGYCFFNSDTVTITEFTLNPIVLNPSGDTAVCIGESITIYADQGYQTYIWSNGANTPQITVSTPGQYSYIAIDGNGCTLQSQDTANVISVPRPAADILVSDASICDGQTTATLSVSPVAGIVYTWTPGNVVGSSVVVDTAGTYYLQASDNGCINLDSTVITSTVPPVATLGADQNICSCDTTVVLDPQVQGTYVWSTGATTATLPVNASGTYSVVVTDNNDCTASDTAEVNIRCLTADAFVADPSNGTVFIGRNAAMTVNTSYQSSFDYLWTPSTYLDDTTNQNVFATAPQTTTTYVVYVTDAVNGCTAVDTVLLRVLPPGIPPMPNAFTPNGDGVNDTYGPYIPAAMQGIYTVTAMRIYDRWGNMVYNGTANWDGTFNNVLQPAETYIYYITINGPNQSDPNQNVDFNLVGSFTLIH